MSRIVFITGATSGIGRACAEKFAAASDNIIINGRRTDRLEELKNSLEKHHGVKVLTAPFDVQDKKEVFDFIGNLQEEWAPDILLNNAGLGTGKGLF